MTGSAMVSKDGATEPENALFHGFGPQPLRIDVDDERREQNETADQYLQEAIDIDVIEPIVKDAEHEQADNGIADAAAAAEQACATDHDGGDRIEQGGVGTLVFAPA